MNASKKFSKGLVMVIFEQFFEQYFCSVFHDRREAIFEFSNFTIFAQFKFHLNIDCKFIVSWSEIVVT